MKLLERITVEPGKCGRRPCIRGMRIRVTDLEPDDIMAALTHVARQSEHAVLQPA